MPQLRRRRFADAVWVPLRASKTTTNDDGSEEFFGCGCVAFPPHNRTAAEALGWGDLGIIHNGGPYAFSDGSYKHSEIYRRNDVDDLGIDLILTQHPGNGLRPIYHINQDLILALNIVREGSNWRCPSEEFVDVIREIYDDDGRATSIEIRSDFLKDYLCARNLSLRLSYYRQRKAFMKDISHIEWKENGVNESSENHRFSARVFSVDQDGGPSGSRFAVFKSWRTDVDPEEDVPVFLDENDENTKHESHSYQRTGTSYFRVEGELWREEWIDANARSVRVRRDSPTTIFSYIIDASGRTEGSDALNFEDIGRYLWFNNDVVNAVLSRRGAGIQWYTRNTGNIYANCDWPVHFGVNHLGNITVYAYDVANLPEWQQRVWAGHNIPPQGGVCEELLDAQMKTNPANTEAPEILFGEEINKLDIVFINWLGKPLFNSHHSIDDIMKHVNRFRATNKDGVLRLAKDITRIVCDNINIETLRIITTPPKGEKWGSLKSLERALSQIVPAEQARSLMSVLVGTYELRLGDAHLPSRNIEDAFRLANVDCSTTYLEQGLSLIDNVVNALRDIRDVIAQRDQK